MAMTSDSTSRRGRKKIMNEINVTPLVDVMLVLLIIFMVAAPMMQQGIDVELPETRNAGIEAKEEPFVVVVKKNRKIYAADTEIPISNLNAKLKAIFETRKNKQVYIQADKAVDYGVVAEVMAEVRGAGITSIGLVTLPKTN